MSKHLLCSIIIFFITMSVGCSSPEESLSPPEGMVLVPASEFIMGSNKTSAGGKEKGYETRTPLYLSEHPERKVFLGNFFIDIFEVTNAKYLKFDPSHKFEPKKHDHPVVKVNWYDADQFCRSLKKELPTEAEWEKAARGTDGREYPWGNQFDELKTNTGKYTLDTTPVWWHKDGVSPYGVHDMAGNVWEWTSNWFKAYPGSDYESESFGEKYKVIRGGARVSKGHYNLPAFFRSAHRLGVPPNSAAEDTGFRCVKRIKK